MPDFPIHVDASCLSDATDHQIASKRNDSDQTVIRNEVECSHSQSEGSQIGSGCSDDDSTEAFIHAAAQAVIASMKENGYGREESVLSARTEDGYEAGTEGPYEDGTELTYGDVAELEYDSEVDHSNRDLYDGSASSHHEDDVFSEGLQSNRSSLNSCTDGDEMWKRSEDEVENEHQAEHLEQNNHPTSRVPSTTSDAYSLLPEPLNVTPLLNLHTPTKVLSRPAFRTPSSVRAMQMSSPTPSIFSGSSRSIKRPIGSQLGTPNAHNHSPTKNKTPTRFKVKKEYPLVLLHVTVLPLQWSSGDVLDAIGIEGLPRELQGVKESWKVLKEKLGDMVLERGILLPHPQDSYEVLEERLLEALELPVKPRAKILSCGHYLGPDNVGDVSSEEDSENEDDRTMMGSREQWCDICGREVNYAEIGTSGKQKRFRVKVYASNGLMRAGAWAAAWREMERVDVELEPFISPHLAPLMDSVTAFHAQPLPTQAFDCGVADHPHQSEEFDVRPQGGDETARKEMEAERIREIYGESPPPASGLGDQSRPYRASSNKQRYGDSLPELIWAAIKVLLRDKKQVAIFILSILVLVLALRPNGNTLPSVPEDSILKLATAGTEMGATVLDAGQDIMVAASEKVAEIPAQILDVVAAMTNEAAALVHTEETSEASAKQKLGHKTEEGGPVEIESLENGAGAIEGSGDQLRQD